MDLCLGDAQTPQPLGLTSCGSVAAWAAARLARSPREDLRPFPLLVTTSKALVPSKRCTCYY